MAGLQLDDWQQWTLYEAMSEASSGRWSAFEVAVLVSRQNGKGSILEARQLAGLYLTHERLQVHTAHEFKTCFEHFLRVVQLIESCPELDNKVMRIRRGAGEQAIELKSGERLRFLARSGGSGRGMSGDTVYLDEAFALTSSIMGALLPTLSARPNPQLWYMSSAPKSTSEVLLALRKRGHEGESPRLFFADWGHERGVDISDRDAWYAANPALGIRITEEFVEAEFAAMISMPDEFARERLGVPDEMEGVVVPSIPSWPDLADSSATFESHRQWALVVSPDRKWASIGRAGRTSSGKLLVDWHEHQPGTGWIVNAVVKVWLEKRVPIRIHKSGPESAFIQPLREAGVEVVEVSSAEVAQATGQLIDAAGNGGLVHLGQATLDAAVRAAVLRMSSDGAVLWSQRSSEVDITTLQAVTVAAGGVPAIEDNSGGFTDLNDLLDDDDWDDD